jgi:hypothetical protein
MSMKFAKSLLRLRPLPGYRISPTTPTKYPINIESNGINEEMEMSGEVRQNIYLVFKEANIQHSIFN